MDIFKQISHQFFPSEAIRERNASISSTILLIISALMLSKDDNEVIVTEKKFNIYKDSLSKEEKERFSHTLNMVSDVLDYSIGIIYSPKNKSIALNKSLDEVMLESKEDSSDKTRLIAEISKYSFRCASLSIIGMLKENLSEQEKEEHFIMQQGRLNIALQNKWEGQAETNYWYALHWFMRENKENAKFFLKNLFKDNKTTFSIDWLINDDKNWLKDKIPHEFHQFVAHVQKDCLQDKHTKKFKS